VEMRFAKWDGSPHWRYVVEPLGRDRHGSWFGGRAGIPMRRGPDEPIFLTHDFVMLVPADAWWIAFWNGPGETDIAVYVDVTTPPVETADATDAVDLDLDVVRTRDGTVELLDEDEFAEHRARYGYPDDVVARAVATADDLVARISNRTEPFDETGTAWLTRYRRASP